MKATVYKVYSTNSSISDETAKLKSELLMWKARYSALSHQYDKLATTNSNTVENTSSEDREHVQSDPSQLGLIILGYPGVGKTSRCAMHPNWVDLESSDYSFPQDIKIYIESAAKLAAKGMIVFVATHEIIQDNIYRYSQSYGITKDQIISVVPSVELSKSWCKRLCERVFDVPEGVPLSWKNRRAAARALLNLESDVEILQNCNNVSHVFVIDSLDYDLNKLVTAYLSRLGRRAKTKETD